jgi:multidrug resistance efflux pump
MSENKTLDHTKPNSPSGVGSDIMDNTNSSSPLGVRVMEKIDIQDKEVELRSEEVQEVLGSVPSWILRRGITLLALIVIVLIVGSWFFKYPEIISSPLVLTTATPPAGIVAKTSGKIIELRVTDQQFVKKGDCLAIIENPASYNDVLFLEKEIKEILMSVSSEKPRNLSREDLKLGALQAAYSGFLLNLKNYNKFIELNYYPQKISALKQLISANKTHYQSTLKQKEIVLKQHELEQRIFDREAYLKKREMISEEESDKAKGQLLQSNMSLQNMQSTLEGLQIQILQMDGNLVDLQQQYLEKKNTQLSELNATANQLQNEIRSWEMSYLLISPLDGKITFSNYWCINQNVTAGQVIFSVVPKVQTELIGKAQLPAERSGKVKTGQRVNIHFVNYPDNEYGMVQGVVNRISLIPTEGKYTVEVKFPQGLMTSYGRKLPLSYEMTANADIVTDDLRLIEQFFLPLKRVFKENL